MIIKYASRLFILFFFSSSSSLHFQLFCIYGAAHSIYKKYKVKEKQTKHTLKTFSCFFHFPFAAVVILFLRVPYFHLLVNWLIFYGRTYFGSCNTLNSNSTLRFEYIILKCALKSQWLYFNISTDNNKKIMQKENKRVRFEWHKATDTRAFIENRFRKEYYKKNMHSKVTVLFHKCSNRLVSNTTEHRTAPEQFSGKGEKNAKYSGFGCVFFCNFFLPVTKRKTPKVWFQWDSKRKQLC